MKLKSLLLVGVAIGGLPGAANAQDEARPGQAAPIDANEIIVTGNITFRNRTEDPNPVLSYDLEYFQRFEPVSVGEMLRRVPGVTFTSDVLEYDGAQMRGLPAGFTQILVNGRRAPGNQADRSFFVDRIPAELVERIEIVRAPRADQPSDGIAGTINVITKESVQFRGGFLRGGLLINEDGEVRPSIGAAYAGELGPNTSFWVAANLQQRRNPKEKVSLRFGDEVPATADETHPEFDNVELQSDTRDGTDISANAEITHRFPNGGRIRVTGLIVDTDRDEDETSLTYEGADLDFEEFEIQQERISQRSYAIEGDAQVPMGFAELGLGAGWSGFREDTTSTVFVGEEEDFSDSELDDEESLNIVDDELSGTASLTFGDDSPLEAKLGIDLLHKERDGLNDGDFLSGEFNITEDRYDPYARLSWRPSPVLTVDAGLRYEITRRQITGEGGSGSFEDEMLNPSVHLRYAPSANDQFRVSFARTVRRPDYDLISPIEEDESPADGDVTVGNPELRNQSAWGVDVGYERRIGRNGIFGVNFFYRDIEDLIELVNTGEDVIDDDDEVIGSVYTPQNIGDGRTWGFEVDFSAPLTFLGMPDTGIFANYTYLDSETTDPFTGLERRFNDQPRHLYNAGFIQTVRAANISFGANISGRSDSFASNFDETVRLSYDPDLEAFLEWRFHRSFVLRLSAQNLLNREKRETFTVYDGDNLEEILEARAEGDIDEFELESEQAGRLFQVTLRAAF